MEPPFPFSCRALKTGESSEFKKPPLPTPGGKETLLLVEDEDQVRNLARKQLQTHGYRVLEARDGFEALKVFPSHQDQISLLISDVVMPRMSGPELAHQLRRQKPGLRCLFMSGYPVDVVPWGGLLSQRVFVQKPFASPDFLGKVRGILDGKS